MSSDITDAPPDKLINLIYHHLKENGYKKAARALKKHAPQVATKKVKVSLSEIFQKWASSDDGGVQTAAKRQRGSSTGITAPSAGSASKSAKLKKKETGTKPRRRKKSTSEDFGVPPPVAAPGNDSNSDSSLDVEKWKNFLSQLSDADQAKMDALSVLDESLVIGKPAAKRTRKPRTSKKEDNQAKGKSNTPAKKTGAKSDDVPVTADASKTHSKKPKGKDAGVPEVKTPPKKTQNKKDRSISDLDVAEAPKRTKAKTTHNSIDQAETDKEAHHETNGLLETGTPSTRTKETGVSDSEAIRTPKRVHFEMHDSFSQQVETPNTWKDDGTSETRSIDTPSKKVKKKKGRSEAGDVQTDDCPSNNIQEVIETNLTMDQSEMPSKKAKNKKSKSVVEPIPNETPSKKVKAKKTEGPSEIDQETTSEKAPESVNPESSSKKAKRKANESLSETVESETPSKKAKDVEKPSEMETPGKKSQKVNDLQSDSKKRKGTVVPDGVEIQPETPEKTSQSQAQTKDDVGDGLGNEDTSSQELKTPPKKIKKHKREEACDVPAMPEAKNPKKDKVKDKDKEGENGGDTLQSPPPPPEEEAASVAITQKKKKKKKEKEREGETAPDDPPEVAVHKKKKKSSKEKPLGSDEGLNCT